MRNMYGRWRLIMALPMTRLRKQCSTLGTKLSSNEGGAVYLLKLHTN